MLELEEVPAIPPELLAPAALARVETAKNEVVSALRELSVWRHYRFDLVRAAFVAVSLWLVLTLVMPNAFFVGLACAAVYGCIRRVVANKSEVGKHWRANGYALFETGEIVKLHRRHLRINSTAGLERNTWLVIAADSQTLDALHWICRRHLPSPSCAAVQALDQDTRQVWAYLRSASDATVSSE